MSRSIRNPNVKHTASKFCKGCKDGTCITPTCTQCGKHEKLVSIDRDAPIGQATAHFACDCTRSTREAGEYGI